MQTLINILAVGSFAVSASVVGAGTYIYLNKDLLIERATSTIAESVLGSSQLGSTILSSPSSPIPSSGGGIPEVQLPF